MDFISQNLSSLRAFAPDLFLIFVSVAVLLLGAFVKNGRRSAIVIGITALMAYIGLSGYVFSLDRTENYGFSGMIATDDFSLFFKVFSAFASCVTLLFIGRTKSFKNYSLAEIVAFILALTVGMSMMAAATDLLMAFLALEMVSILSYIMVGYAKHNRPSSEAGLKYILYGSVASGMMIFGFSYLFGLAGSTGYADLAHYFKSSVSISIAPILLFALLASLVGFGFKIATFPSQMWCPDVYEGAPTPVTAFLSVGPKAAGFAMTARFFYQLFDLHGGNSVQIFQFINWGVVLAMVAAVTMTLGNLAAIPQRNLKRLMAYSSIAHAGYLMMGLTTLSQEGIQAILFYLVIYLFMNLGAFLIILMLADELGSEDIEAYRGLGYRSPFLAALLAIFLISLTGLPPLAGFIGKFYLFAAVIKAGMTMTGIAKHMMYALAIFAAINTVISLVYYARILRKMYLETPLESTQIRVSGFYRALSLALAIPVILLGIYWSPLANIVNLSAASLF